MSEAVVEQQTTVTPTEGAATAAEQVSQAETQTTETEATSEADKPKRRDGGFQRRIDQLTRRNYELEAQVRAERESRQTQPQTEAKGEPKRDQYESYEAFLEAKAEFAADKAADTRMRKFQEQQQRTAAEHRARELSDSWASKLDKARDTHDDYDDVVQGSAAQITREMTQAIMESDIGPQLVYHLAQHPEDAERISKLSATSAAREIGRIEAALLAPKPKPKASEHKPILPVGGSGAASEGPNDKQSIKDWMASRNKQLGRK